eukprot:5121233-Karenia_brevis.AAC.1
MLTDWRREAGLHGLTLHPDKTKVLTNATRGCRNKAKAINIDDMSVEVLPTTGRVKYLGRQLGFESFHGAELENRIAAAWKKFALYKQELTNKKYPLKIRARLFHAVVTPTVLYGCEAWVLTKDLEM